MQNVTQKDTIDTTTMTKTKINVGLQTKNGLPIHPDEVIETISEYVEAGTFNMQKGLWKGELEKSMGFECANINNHMDITLKELQDKLAAEFEQESVMIEQEQVEVAF